MSIRILIPICAGLALSIASAGAAAADWPMWRCDAGRTAVTSAELPEKLALAWVRTLPPPRTAWKDEQDLMFDKVPMPVAAGDLLFLGSTVNDSITAYDLATGAERWRFYTEGPIRVAPAVWRDRVFAGSDDGFLYCLAAGTGELLWKFRGGPCERRLVGNERIISTWPVRGGPVIADDTVYFAAGVWPFMGAFVHALDCATGSVRWTNDGVSFVFRTLPHPGAAGFSGLAPQGHLVVAGDRLIVPGSRGKPFVFDRGSGEFLFVAEGVSPQVCAQGRLAFAGGQVFETGKGRTVKLVGFAYNSMPVLGADKWYAGGGGIYLPSTADVREVLVSPLKAATKVFELQSAIGKAAPLAITPFLRAGSRLVSPGKNDVKVIDPTTPEAQKVVWEGAVDGAPLGAIVAGGKLIVATETALHCFAAAPAQTVRYALDPGPAASAPSASDAARDILAVAGVREGYCLVLGIEDGNLVDALVRASDFHIVAVDPDASRIAALRTTFGARELYGTRVAAINAEPCDAVFAPYYAGLVVSENVARAGLPAGARFAERVVHVLRPYGGTACFALTAEQRAALADAVGAAKVPGTAIVEEDGLTLLVREGSLPGAADWSGQNADPGNTRVSRDTLVKAPLGVLWFGNSLSNTYVLPRHGEGPVEQVVGGRLFIEGNNSISAADVYTGRFLWSRSFPDIGKYYDNTLHQRGAHVLGANFFAVPDAVYVAAGLDCQALDPSSGRVLRTFTLPRADENEPPSPWQFLLVYEDLLLAGAEASFAPDDPTARALLYNTMASSRRLVAFDRHGGAVKWIHRAVESLPHYGIVAGNGKVFCIDRVSVEKTKALARRGLKPETSPHVLALDARDGRVLWSVERDAGQVLSYSATHDLLLADAALSGADGSVRWQLPRGTPPLHDGKWGPLVGEDSIITQLGREIDLRTGAIRMRSDADGKEQPWRIRRSYGCGPMAGGLQLVTFRSGCAGFFDLAHDGGTANLGGFRSGCTPNLIPADGVLCAPDYTRTCVCRYQNRSSLALVHMPDAEYWTFGADFDRGRMGLNFGAPGDRRAPDGTLWRAAPCPYDAAYGGRTLFAADPASPKCFVRHSSCMREGEGWKWVGASGAIGLRKLTIPHPGFRGAVKVRLYFAEPVHAEAGNRVFSVDIDGRRVLTDLDIVKEAGASLTTIVRESACQLAEKPALEVTFTPQCGEPLLCGIELIQRTPRQ